MNQPMPQAFPQWDDSRAAPLDEPGYVVSQIQANGYLRVAPVGGGAVGVLYHQFLEGHDVRIGTASGPRDGRAD